MEQEHDPQVRAVIEYLGKNGWSGYIPMIDAVHAMEKAAGEDGYERGLIDAVRVIEAERLTDNVGDPEDLYGAALMAARDAVRRLASNG